MKRALLSVWDKTGLDEFARGLVELDFELVSSGNTADALTEAGIPVTRVEDVTGSPEMLGGRVKTLHPRIHGGILADRGKPEQVADLETYGIAPFDLVVSNLYPFLERPDIETIDIGGPAMVRAAAKNHAWVGVVTDPSQYAGVLEGLRAGDGALGDETRLSVLAKLCRGEPQSIARLTAGTNLTRQGVTKHLRVLESAGVVRSVRVGRESLFELEPKPIEDAREYLLDVSRQWDDALARLKAHLED